MADSLLNQTEFNYLKQDPTFVHYHYDHAKRITTEQWDIFNKTEQKQVREGTQESLSTNLYRHDIYPGYVNQKPLSLQK